jgi:DNA (cytosine-5)-methyltransferase 1/tRNA (cytosine38-C5)-methyltransferase
MRILELFCGIGGLAAALSGTDARVVCAMDHDPGVLDTYRRNNPEHQAVRADLSRITPWQLATPGADLWWLSPPCQPYSVRGNQRDLDDPRAISFRRILEILERLPAGKLPPGLALENVPGFLDSQARERLVAVLTDRGYHLREQLICPTDLGVPMRRERYYLAAAQAPLLLLPPRSEPRQRRVLGDYVDHHLGEETPEELLVPEETIDRFGSGLCILDPDDTAACATCFAASYGKTLMHAGAYLRCRRGVRHFAPKEIARLLGLPAGFSFPPGLPLRRQWHQLGNSLSVDAVRAVLAILPRT